MTWYSCIASSSADCVFGGVRLISSARMMLAKIGPGMKRIARDPRGAVLLDDLGADDVDGHQVGRELDAAELEVDGLGQRLDEQRLGQARHAAQQHVPAGEKRGQDLRDDLLLPDDDAPQLALEAAARLAACAKRQRLERRRRRLHGILHLPAILLPRPWPSRTADPARAARGVA